MALGIVLILVSCPASPRPRHLRNDLIVCHQVECALMLNAGVQLKARDREENMEEQYAALATLRCKKFSHETLATKTQVSSCLGGRGGSCGACAK